MKAEVAADIRAIFNAADRNTAEKGLQAAIQKYAVSASRLSAWMEENLAEGFTMFDFPLEHRRSIRTTNSLERVTKRSNVASGWLAFSRMKRPVYGW